MLRSGLGELTKPFETAFSELQATIQVYFEGKLRIAKGGSDIGEARDREQMEIVYGFMGDKKSIEVQTAIERLQKKLRKICEMTP